MIGKMFDLKTVSLFLLILIIKDIECQGLFGGRQSSIDKLPGVGACDRIASRGVANCMENFLPTNVLSGFTGGPRGRGSGGDICCSYSKYRACINGLHTGLRIAMERERCPKSYSTKIIKSLGDSTVGLPLKSFCGNGSGGRSQCPKSGNNKPKKNQKQPKRTPERTDTIGSAGGIGDIGDTIGGVFQPARDVFERGTGGRRDNKDRDRNNNPLGGFGGIGDTIGGVFQPARDIFEKGTGGRRDNRDRDSGNRNNNPLGGIGDTFGGVFQPARDIFEKGTGSRRDNRDRDSGDRNNNPLGGIGDTIGGVFNKGKETFEQGASSVIGGLQSAFGGLGNVGKNSNL